MLWISRSAFSSHDRLPQGPQRIRAVAHGTLVASDAGTIRSRDVRGCSCERRSSGRFLVQDRAIGPPDINQAGIEQSPHFVYSTVCFPPSIHESMRIVRNQPARRWLWAVSKDSAEDRDVWPLWCVARPNSGQVGQLLVEVVDLGRSSARM